MARRWQQIHSFFDGWGWYDVSIGPTKQFFLSELIACPEVPDDVADLDDLTIDDVYEKLKAWQAAQPQPELPTPSFDRITVPKFTKEPYWYDLRRIVAGSPIKDPQEEGGAGEGAEAG